MHSARLRTCTTVPPKLMSPINADFHGTGLASGQHVRRCVRGESLALSSAGHILRQCASTAVRMRCFAVGAALPAPCWQRYAGLCALCLAICSLEVHQGWLPGVARRVLAPQRRTGGRLKSKLVDEHRLGPPNFMHSGLPESTLKNFNIGAKYGLYLYEDAIKCSMKK
jgi:hypothetical protein